MINTNRNKLKNNAIIKLILLLFLICFCVQTRASEQSNFIAKYYFTQGVLLETKSKYTDAISFFEKANSIYKNNAKWEKYILGNVEVGKCYRLIQDYKNAECFYSIAENLAIKKFNKSNIIFARIYGSKAILLCDMGDYNKSIVLAEESISINKKSLHSNDTLTAQVYNTIGTDYYYLGKYDKSLMYYNKSLLYAGSLVDSSKTLISECLSSIGCVYWVKGDYNLSATYLTKAIEIQLSSKNYPEDLAYSYNILATLYYQTGYFEQAVANYNKAENILLKNNFYDHSLLGNIYYSEASVNFHLQDYEKAVGYCMKALPILKKNYKKNARELYYLYYYLGKIYNYYGDKVKAPKLLNESIAINSKFKLPFDPYATFYLAKVYENLDEMSKADSLYKCTYNLNNLKSGNWDSTSYAQLCICYGIFSLKQCNFNKAESLLIEALNIQTKKSGISKSDLAVVQNSIGDLYLKKGQYDKSLKYFQSAITSVLRNFKPRSITDNPDLSRITADANLMYPLKGKARALQMKYLYVSSDTNDLSASLNTYTCAINAIEKLRLLFGNTESSTALLSNENDVYDGAIETAALLYKKTNNEKYFSQAFTFAEKSKSASLLNAVRSNDAMIAAKVPDELQDVERNLRKKANQYKYLINQESAEKQPSDIRITLWNAKLDTLQKQHDVLMNYISKNFPEYYNLGFNTNVLCDDSVKKRLNANEAFIEYVCTSDNIYAFALTRQTKKIISIKNDSNFINILTQYQNSISSTSSKNGGDHSIFITSATSLYSRLVEPFESIIKNKSLIIIPDEELYNVPFECLLTKDVAKESKFNSLPYLIKESAISYAGSATLLYSTKSTVTSNTDKLLAFAPSYESTGANADTSEVTRNLMKSITPLLGTKEEVDNIGQIMEGDVFEGNNATLQNFKSKSSGYDILHLAMHTMIDNEDPMNSKLVFGADNNSYGMLNTYELYSMKLDAKLAVLSACNTGKGKMLKGEGMLCLARGFMYAGCPSLVMTLWEINDRTGSKLMQNFYKYLSQGKSKDEALRLSKLDYLSTSDDMQANPYYWAGYINFGNHDPIISITGNNVKYRTYAIPAALLVIASASLFIFRKRRLFNKA